MHPLQKKIVHLRSRLRQLLLLYGVGATVAAIVAAAVALGAADYLLRLRDPGVRMLSSLGLLAVFVWTAYRCLWVPLSTHLADAEIALRLKRRFPELGDQLACALEFLNQPDDEPTAGSPALRRAVIERTWHLARPLDFRTALDPRAAFRAAGFSLVACLVAAVLIALDPISARIAVARLARPVAAPAWPQQTHLEFRNPVQRVARGQAFEVEVIDRRGARLPDDVQIEYRLLPADGTSAVQREPLRRRSRTTAFARRESVTRPFAYRAAGGDDRSMPWLEVEVAEPPAMDELVLRLSPPEYTSCPPYIAEKHLRVLEGTSLAVSGTANKPLGSLLLHLSDREPIAAALDREGRRFRIAAPGEREPSIDVPGEYWFELVDVEGLRSESPQWDLHTVPDPPPSVTFEQPSASLFVTPDAVVPVRVVAKDNLAVRQITLNYRIDSSMAAHGRLPELSQRGEEDVRPDDHSAATTGISTSHGSGAEGERILFEGPAKAPPPANGRPSPLDSPGDHRVAETRWALEPLGLRPGDQLILTATADDYLPATGESLPIRLSVITRRELEDRIAARQNLILAELRRALDMQRSSRSQVAELAVRLDEVKQLARPDVDHLQAAELAQRRIEGDLTGQRESVPAYVADLLADLDNNRVDRPDLRRRMESLLAELDGLARGHLPPIRHELTTAIKSAQAGSAPPGETWPADPAVAQSLLAAGGHQDRVIATLEQILEDLGRWDNYRRFFRDVGRLLREQEDIGTRTVESGRRTMGRDPRELPPADVAELRVLAAGQLELARQLDRMAAGMERAAGQLETTDPLAADTLAHAVDEIRRRSLSGLMRTGSAHLEQNRLGQAVEVQQGVRGILQDVLDILANRREHELERLIERLHEMEAELAGLLRRQTDVAAGFRDAAGEQEDEAEPEKGSGAFSRNGPEAASQKRLPAPFLESLARRQAELADESLLAARRLERLLIPEAARSATQASGRMSEAGQAAAAGNAAGGAEQSGQARELLELAHRHLEARRRQAQAELVAEQLARLEDAVKHLHNSQQKVVDATQGLDQLADSPDGLTRAHLADLNDVVRLQLSTESETRRLSAKLVGAEAVQLVLDGAAGYMAEAAAWLGQQQTGPPTQQLAARARDQLAMLIEAFHADPADPSHDPAGGGAGSGEEGESMGEPIVAAEIKLLKLLQQDINLRTAELAVPVAGPQSISEAQRGQFDRLVEEQGQLADLTLGLLSEPAEEDDDLLRELGQAGVSEDAHPLLAIARQMRDVQARLGQRAADGQTTAMQEQIVAQLDALLQQARSQASASGESARQAPATADRQPRPQPDVLAGGADRDPREAPARESADEPRAPEPVAESPGQQRALHAMERLWNQLPERQREQLLQLAPEQFLPKYESLIEQYFRRLSQDQGR